jgi:hypothetical protein
MSGSPRWASYFVGRAFSTRLELPDEAVWEPLEAVARLSRMPGARRCSEVSRQVSGRATRRW